MSIWDFFKKRSEERRKSSLSEAIADLVTRLISIKRTLEARQQEVINIRADLEKVTSLQEFNSNVGSSRITTFASSLSEQLRLIKSLLNNIKDIITIENLDFCKFPIKNTDYKNREDQTNLIDALNRLIYPTTQNCTIIIQNTTIFLSSQEPNTSRTSFNLISKSCEEIEERLDDIVGNLNVALKSQNSLLLGIEVPRDINSSTIRKWLAGLALVGTLATANADAISAASATPAATESIGVNKALQLVMSGAWGDPTFINSQESICARYVAGVVNAIAKSSDTSTTTSQDIGLFGSAWDFSKNIKLRGGSTVWKYNSTEFTDFNNLKPFDVIGTYFSGSRYNTESTTGYTHVILVLGQQQKEWQVSTVSPLKEIGVKFGVNIKAVNYKEIIGSFGAKVNGLNVKLSVEGNSLGYYTNTPQGQKFVKLKAGDRVLIAQTMVIHYYHEGRADPYAVIDKADGGARIESAQHFFSKFSGQFSAREIMRPNVKKVTTTLNNPWHILFASSPYRVTAQDMRQRNPAKPQDPRLTIMKKLLGNKLDESNKEYWINAFNTLNPQAAKLGIKGISASSIIYLPTRQAPPLQKVKVWLQDWVTFILTSIKVGYSNFMS